MRTADVIGNAGCFIRIAKQYYRFRLMEYGEVRMLVQPVPIIARRMMVLLSTVVAINAAVALLAPHPAIWCAIIPTLIILLTPVAIFFPRARAAN